jgi:hypothetical protein
MARTRPAWSPDRVVCRGLGLGLQCGAVIGVTTLLLYLLFRGSVGMQIWVLVVSCGLAAVIGGLIGLPCGLLGAVAILLVLADRPGRGGTGGTGGTGGSGGTRAQPVDTWPRPAGAVVIRAAAAAGAAVPPAGCAILAASGSAAAFFLTVAAEAAVGGAVLGPRAAWGRHGDAGQVDAHTDGPAPLNSAE